MNSLFSNKAQWFSINVTIISSGDERIRYNEWTGGRLKSPWTVAKWPRRSTSSLSRKYRQPSQGMASDQGTRTILHWRPDTRTNVCRSFLTDSTWYRRLFPPASEEQTGGERDEERQWTPPAGYRLCNKPGRGRCPKARSWSLFFFYNSRKPRKAPSCPMKIKSVDDIR